MTERVVYVVSLNFLGQTSLLLCFFFDFSARQYVVSALLFNYELGYC